jgi:hypothetical protein
MSFLGLRNDLALRIVDWGLPAPIIRGFVTELDREFSQADPSTVPANRSLGMNTNIIVVDPDDPGKRYVFFIRLARNDDDFWVTDVSCLGVDEANKVFWKPA